jgi:hypothetical protein
MFKTVIKSALAASLAAGGMIALTAGVASAGGVTITAGTGSSVTCGLNSTAKLAPALKNNWNADSTDNADHPAVAALPTTVFAANGPVAISAKATGSCTGTAVQGTASAPLTALGVSIAAEPGTGSTDPASCANLIADSATSTQKFDLAIKWTGTGAKITPTTITGTGLGISTSPIGFGFSGGTVSGSFAGGTVKAVAAVSASLIAAVSQPQETGDQAVAGTYTSLGCEPTLKVKVASTKKPESATLKGPKGLKSIVISSTDGSELTASA